MCKLNQDTIIISANEYIESSHRQRLNLKKKKKVLKPKAPPLYFANLK